MTVWRGPRKTVVPGQVFGSLTVVGRVGTSKHGFIQWSCLCSCGKLATATTGELNSGGKASCGCQQYAAKRLPPDECVLSRVYAKYRESARARGFAFGLTRADFRALVLRPCHYCGASPSKVRRMKPADQRAYTFVCNGVDRVDNLQGYTLDNSVPCCEDCNRAKLQMSAEQYIRLCHRVAQLHPSTPDLSPAAERTR